MTPAVAPVFLPSPKRKRENSELIKPFAPALNTTFRGASPPALSSGENSPRTTVANQLSELQLRNSIPIIEFGVRDGEKDRKKAKKLDFPDIPSTKIPFDKMNKDTIVVKTLDTDQMAKPQEASQTASAEPNASLQWHFLDAGKRETTSNHPKAHSSAKGKETLSPVQSPTAADLTWQEDEITGHLISTEDPDDDGTGINGIGFKPTPAIAYARSMKRKQQVLDWRAREAREARQKRWEGRRAGLSRFEEKSDGKVLKGRVVRFA